EHAQATGWLQAVGVRPQLEHLVERTDLGVPGAGQAAVVAAPAFGQCRFEPTLVLRHLARMQLCRPELVDHEASLRRGSGFGVLVQGLAAPTPPVRGRPPPNPAPRPQTPDVSWRPCPLVFARWTCSR